VRIGRVVSLLSLLTSCFFVALIVRRLTDRWYSAIFSAAFCLALFCAADPTGVASNDPQMFAHPFFLAGLWIYLNGADSTLQLAAVAGLFVFGGNIKHNLFPAPISVATDLLLRSRKKGGLFLLLGAVFLGTTIAITMDAEGRFFLSQMLMPRGYSLHRA